MFKRRLQKSIVLAMRSGSASLCSLRLCVENRLELLERQFQRRDAENTETQRRTDFIAGRLIILQVALQSKLRIAFILQFGYQCVAGNIGRFELF
jgi:hypothetical protein